MRNICWSQHSQLAHGFKPHVLALGSDVLPGSTFVIGPVDDLVVNVGDV